MRVDAERAVDDDHLAHDGAEQGGLAAADRASHDD
jgi:hypothetical protein